MAIAISCYSRGVSLDKKIFFPVWTCIKPNLVSKNFPFTRGGSLNKKFFFPVWTCIKPNLVSKNFPFTRGGRGGGPSTKIFFFQSEHVSSQIWCQKNFPLLGGGGPSTKKFFSHSEHVSSQIWCQKFFPLLRPGHPSPSPPPIQGWIRYPPPKVWIDTQSENITSRHPSDAGGNN